MTEAKFLAFERIRESGVTNMFDYRMVIEERRNQCYEITTLLTPQLFFGILKNKNFQSHMRHISIFLLVMLFLTLPNSVQAGWRDLPKPVILSAESVVNGQSIVRFSLPEFANRPVKVYATARHSVGKSTDYPSGVRWTNQEGLMTLDAAGKGSIVLRNLKEKKAYRVMVSLKQLEPHIKRSQNSKLKKLRSAR